MPKGTGLLDDAGSETDEEKIIKCKPKLAESKPKPTEDF